MVIPTIDDYCFVCGRNNPRGLKIKVRYDDVDLAAETELALPREFQGWAEVIHGGILATLLDEMMAHAVWHFAGAGLTLGMEIKFYQPLQPEEAIRVRGVLLPSPSGKRRQATAAITRLSDDNLIASAKSRFLLIEQK
jgi:acyl-coenzyme A thioesterase PaaI-like protein